MASSRAVSLGTWRSAVVVALSGVLAGTLLAPATGSSGSSAAADDPGTPAIAYSLEDSVVVVDRRGTVLSRVPRGFGGYSLGGNLLAKAYDARRRHTIGYNATTGEPKFRINDTMLIPTVVRGGRAVAFSGQDKRDPNAASLWIRNRLGRERKLAQFRFGRPGSPAGTGPVIPTHLSDGFVMEYSFNRAADTVAVAVGDDTAFFRYDIWAIDVSTRDYVRLTQNLRSRWPTISPNGDKVAYFREDSICGGPVPGYRGGDLFIMNSDGTDRYRLHDGGCDRFFTRPRWLDNYHLVVNLLTRRRGEDPQPLYNSQLVMINTVQRFVSSPISRTDRVGEFSVSPSMKRVAYMDYTQPDGFWVFRWRPASGGPGITDQRLQDPWAHGTTRRFDQGRIPHLRDDSTLIGSF